MTTIFGPDISSYERRVNIGALAHDTFVIAKVTEGTYYTDAYYDGTRTQAKAAGKIFLWYHFLSGEDVYAQVAHVLDHVGDKSLPGMLDVEPTQKYTPTLAHALDWLDAAHSAGLNMRLAYLPRWFHGQIGSPSLSGLTSRGIELVASSYPNQTIHDPGTVYAAIGGDKASGWQPYGGKIPVLLQFTDVAVEGGQTLGDMNAFRGTREQFATLLGATAPTPVPTPATPSGGSPVGTIPPSIAAKWPELAGDFPPNATFTDESALIWADGGARAAALYALQARDAVNALAQRIAAPPPVDVNALAAALAPLLHAGATADEVATAVVAHLASSLQKG